VLALRVGVLDAERALLSAEERGGDAEDEEPHGRRDENLGERVSAAVAATMIAVDACARRHGRQHGVFEQRTRAARCTSCAFPICVQVVVTVMFLRPKVGLSTAETTQFMLNRPPLVPFGFSVPPL